MWFYIFVYLCVCGQYYSSDFTSLFSRCIVSIFVNIFHISNDLFGLNSLAGPQAGAFSYISEFHTSQTAARAVAFSLVCLSGFAIYMSPFAILIVPMDWSWQIFSLNFKPWRLFLICISLINLWNGIVFAFLPESPKFLLALNEKEKALHILRRIYAFNTGQPEQVMNISINTYDRTLMYYCSVYIVLFIELSDKIHQVGIHWE